MIDSKQYARTLEKRGKLSLLWSGGGGGQRNKKNKNRNPIIAPSQWILTRYEDKRKLFIEKNNRISRRPLRKPKTRVTWSVTDAIRKATIKASAGRPARSKTECQK
jgi:hypothetical protein